MKTSESIKNLAKALLTAQTQMGGASKSANNPFFKSKYADLPTVMEVVKQPLNDAGIVVLQPALWRDGKNFIVTTLVHADSGEFMASETEVVCVKQNDPQSFGAAQTYARRFGLQSMLFIPAEDDDGNTASGRVTQNQTKTNNCAPPTTTGTTNTKDTLDTTVAQTVNTMLTSEPLPLGSIKMETFPKTSSFSKKKQATTTSTSTAPQSSVTALPQNNSEAF